MNLPIYLVDAFADGPFSGNPAAVCFPPKMTNVEWMQKVASEMNLSETAFIKKRCDGEFDLRWFTPNVEVDLCGHATLASAHVLWKTERARHSDRIIFHTNSGALAAALREESIVLDFPSEAAESVNPPAALLDSLGVTVSFVGRNRFDYLVEVESERQLLTIEPDFRTMKSLDMRGVIVTAVADRSGFDFVSRYFAPAFGIDEDPATGSAHCCLGPHWQDRIGKNEFVAYQASRRGAVVGVRVLGDRVELSGKAVTVVEGNWVAA